MKRTILVSALAAIFTVATSAGASIPDPVKTETGQLSGTSTATASVRVFKGIPFAAPPTGENRWRAPQPAAKWEGVRKADAFGAPCTSGAGGFGGGGRGGRGAAPGAPGAPGAAAPVVAPGAAAAPSATAAPGASAAQGAPAAPGAAAGGGRGGRGGAPGAGGPQGPPRAPAASEDCLFVNVWTSANKASDKRPVMMWIYGGAFSSGAGSELRYDGEALAAKGPVVVTMNYRLGMLGFLAHPELARESGHNASGNYGMMDAIAALQWVKKNISAFGGDPGNVTIFGESAGAIMIGGLVGSPEAKGLFHRAIAQSGGWMGLQMGRMSSGTQAQGNGAKAVEALGVKSIAELRAKPLAELTGLGGGGLVIDGYMIPEDLSITFANGKQNAVDVLTGSNADEANFGVCPGAGGGGRGGGRGGPAAAGAPAAPAADGFRTRAQQRFGELADGFLKLYPAASDTEVQSAAHVSCADEINWNMRQWAAAQSKKGKKGYTYFFTRVPVAANGQPSPQGATHTAEIQYAFNNPQGLQWNDVDKKLADVMSSYWANFAAKGDPNGTALPAWPAYKDVSKDRVMILGDTVEVESVAPAEKLTFYGSAYARLMKSGTN